MMIGKFLWFPDIYKGFKSYFLLIPPDHFKHQNSGNQDDQWMKVLRQKHETRNSIYNTYSYKSY